MSTITLPPLSRRHALGAGALTFASILAACSAPGADAPSAEASAGAVATTLPDEAVTLQIIATQEGADPITALGKEFTRQHPNVTIEVTAENNTTLGQNISRILTRDVPPDLCFSPAISGLVKDGVLTNLDSYAKAYNWDSWSQELLGIARFDADGKRGQGALYAVGIGYNVTGIFYNKKVAEEIGVSMPPATFADFDDACHKAVAAGKTAIAHAGKAVGTPYLLQEVQNSFGNAKEINDWIFQKPGASFVQPAMIEAAKQLQTWVADGVIPADSLAVDYPGMMAKFQEGNSLFVAVGDWESQRLAQAMGESVGFFIMPTRDPSAPLHAMAAPANYVIPAGSSHKDVAAYFLNWIQSDETARQIVVDKIGCAPGGPTNLPVPASDVPLVQESTAAFNQILEVDGAVDFITNSTPGMGLNTMTPLCQALLLGSVTPEEFCQQVQDGYIKELEG